MALSFGGYTDGLGAASPRSLTIVGGSGMGCLRRTKAVVGLLIHEIGHALGLIHEHKRPDRDQYIKINQANISPGNLAQFDICRDCLTYGIPYNCRSIMHYSAFTMSKNQRPTMTAFNPHTCDIISTHDEFTKEDADGLNIIYKCKGKGWKIMWNIMKCEIKIKDEYVAFSVNYISVSPSIANWYLWEWIRLPRVRGWDHRWHGFGCCIVSAVSSVVVTGLVTGHYCGQ